jgi:PAS domain S-box-containing protein
MDDGLAVLLVVRDITERARMLAELEKSEAKFRLLAELLPALVYIINEQGRILFMNQSSEQVLGYTVEELMQLDYEKVLDIESLERGMRTFQELKVGETANYALKVLDKRGQWRWVDVWITKVEMDGQVLGLGVALDISWRVEMTQALQAHASRLVGALEEERRRIANELHDEVGQQLIGMKFTLERALYHAQTLDTQEAIWDALQQLSDLTEQVRELSLSFRPAMLDDLGLLHTLLWHFKRYTARTGIKVHFNQSGLDHIALPRPHALAAYRIIQEALTNVARYAGVDEVWVTVHLFEDVMVLEIRDEGAGFEPERIIRRHPSSGLKGMRDRVAALSGDLTIESAPGQGTLIRAHIPLSLPNLSAYEPETPPTDHHLSG